VLLVGGAFGALFTILAGGIASIGVFLLAFHGLGKAFTELAKNGKVSNATLKKLAPSARSFVKEIEKLAKPLKGIAKFVQGKFFDGMGKAVAKLAKVWLPALRPMLGGLAKDFNGFARSVLAALSNKDFVKNIQAGVAGFGAFITRLGKAMGPLIDVFGRLAKASVPFLAELGDGIAKVFEKFDAWIKSADKSGGLQKFMKDAAHELHEIWQIGGLVVGIIGDIITIFFPSSKKASGSVLDGVKSALQSIKNWLDDPKNQKKIRDIVANIQDFADKLVTVWIPGITKFLDKLTGFFDKLDGWGKDIGKFADAFGSAFSIMGIAVGAFQVGAKSSLGGVVSSAAGIPGKITKALSGLYNSLFGVGKSVSEGLADGIRAREESAVGAAKHMGHAVEKATRKALKTHSPSRVFMAIGADVADGLALGVKRGEGRVTKAMRSLATPPSDLARSASGASGGRSALVGSLTVNAGKGESTGDALDEALFALRRIARGGVYAR
jgi:hypothetical protein